MKQNRGGARPGAGRRPTKNPTKPISIRLTQAQHAEYMKQGGAKWFKNILQNLLTNRK